MWADYDLGKFGKITKWMSDVYKADERIKKDCDQFVKDLNTAR